MYEIKNACVKGFEMPYMKFGGGKKTMVILPGLSVQSVLKSASAIERSFSLFKEEYTVYLFDRREALPAVYTVDDMARDTVGVLKELSLAGIHLYGASQGGMIAMRIASENPDMIAKLALASTALNVRENNTEVLDGWIGKAEAGDAEGLYLDFGEKLYPPRLFSAFRGMLVENAKNVTSAELTRFCVLARAAIGFDASEDVKKIVCPVFVAGSLDDRVLGGDTVNALIAAFGEARRAPVESCVYDGYGHAVYDTAPDFRKRLYGFFGS